MLLNAPVSQILTLRELSRRHPDRFADMNLTAPAATTMTLGTAIRVKRRSHLGPTWVVPGGDDAHPDNLARKPNDAAILAGLLTALTIAVVGSIVWDAGQHLDDLWRRSGEGAQCARL